MKEDTRGRARSMQLRRKKYVQYFGRKIWNMEFTQKN
jgi:hypothetical protein